MQFLTGIITVVLGFVGNLIKDLILGEQKIAAELKAKALEEKMRSIVVNDKVEKAVRNATPITPTTPEAWNKPRAIAPVLFLLFAFLFLSGCIRYEFIHDKKPFIETPERPAIEETPPFSEREKTIVGYTSTLEARIDAYNKWAKEENTKNGYDIPDKDTKPNR